MSSVIETLLAKEPERRRVSFCLDRELTERLSEAQGELDDASRALRQVRAGGDDAAQAARGLVERLEGEVEVLSGEVRARLVRFTLAAVQPERFDELKDAHPPTNGQSAEARRAQREPPAWNVETFPQALVAESCVRVETPDGVQDGLSLDEVALMWESRAYNASERAELFSAAMDASLTRTVFTLPNRDL